MPEMEHTPGPWSSPGNYGTNRYEVHGAGHRVAIVDRLEDAYLIGAAPQLLAVARGALKYLEDLPSSFHRDESWLQPLRDAIIRATRGLT